MAQTKRKRRRKHRGTQAGTVERAPRPSSRPQTRAEARRLARERRLERLDRPPTWRGALNRAAIAAVLFGVLTVVAFDQPISAAVSLTALVLLLYIPTSYLTDRFLYNRRQRRKVGARQG